MTGTEKRLSFPVCYCGPPFHYTVWNTEWTTQNGPTDKQVFWSVSPRDREPNQPHRENKLFPTQKEKSEPEVDVGNYRSIKPQVLIPPPSILIPSH